MSTRVYTTTLHLFFCCDCGVPFGLEANFEERMREQRTTFFCPNGHSQWFPGRTEKQRRIEAERREQATRDLLRHEERRAATLKGHVTRKKKQLEQVRAGVCPVEGCHRHFQNLQRHIATKHPGYVKGESAA